MDLIIKALGPIAHGDMSTSNSYGAYMNFRRLPFIHNGKIIEVPVISGNSIRSTLRRCLTREFIDSIALEKKLSPSTYDRFYRAIACGGNLEKEIDRTISPTRLREIRTLIPMLSCFGAALYRYMLSGVVNTGFAILKCAELGNAELRIADQLTDVGMVKNPSLPDVSPMPHNTESIVPGAQFTCEITFAPQTTEVEKSCLLHGLSLIEVVGGQSSRGFGRVAISPAPFDDALYIEWLRNISDEQIKSIVAFAEEL